MKSASYMALLAGLALATVLVARNGAEAVTGALAAAGWNVGWVALFFILPMTLAAMGWRHLFVSSPAPSIPLAVHAMWIGGAVNWLLPVAQVGGELVRARLVAKSGVPGAEAGASVIVDKTVQAINVMIYGIAALVLLVTLTGERSAVPGLVIFFAILGTSIFFFFRFQRAGMFGFLAERFSPATRRAGWQRLVGGAEALDQAIRTVYRQPRRVVAAVLWRLAGRVLAAGETWLALWFIGHPVSPVEALLLEGLGQAIRGAAFFVPGALGVQEGSFMLLAPLVGLDPHVGLAVSLMKRGRELLIGVPALVVWQISEGRWLWQGGRQA